MKKFYLLTLAVLSASMMHAGIGLSIEGSAITGDTTLTITQVEIDDFTGDKTMSWHGTAFYTGQLTVYIERERAASEGHEDQLCAGQCMSGTAGELRDTMTFDMGMYMPPVQVFAHYYPETNEAQTIRYRFVGGDEDFTVSVIYDPANTAISRTEHRGKSVKKIENGRIVVLKDGMTYDVLGARLF